MNLLSHSEFMNYFLVRPLSVEIIFSNQPLSADRGYDIECMAVGSRPASKITWWMGGIELSGHTQTVCILSAHFFFNFSDAFLLFTYHINRIRMIKMTMH